MQEYLCADGVAVIEWPQMAEEVLPERRLEIVFTPEGEEGRNLELCPMGGFQLKAATAMDVQEDSWSAKLHRLDFVES